jgi:hypothetical protein
MNILVDRRSVLKFLPAVAGATILEPLSARSARAALISIRPVKESHRPLDEVTLQGADGGTLILTDGAGHPYIETPARSPFSFVVAGALGTHTARVVDAQRRTIASATFQVDCTTKLREQTGAFQQLLGDSVWTMMAWNREAPVNVIRHNGRIYQLFVNWVFDHTLTLKGMKYYWPDLKDAVDFFADTQREDGMIWENCYPATPEANYFDWKFNYGGFVKRLDGGFRQLRRAPVESHVEQFFVDALYHTWKATGDDEWMAAKLDSAVRALGYTTSDPYRWSTKYQLMHRGFTIDTWDYTSDDQQKIGSDCVFVVYLDKSEFGVFFGDNTNLIAACRWLAEMLQHSGRSREAKKFVQLAGTIQARLNKLSWNGDFYTHWIAENPDYHPDVGVDMSKQVALSNAYSLNRGISHSQCVAIINTYRRIRREMPRSSPGEFYGIYPPFQKDFTQNIPGQVWEYVNGGVLTVVAAELAHGAFEHGFEEYGGDILLRQKALAERYRGYLPVTLRGKAYESPQRTFHKLSLRDIANVDTGAGSSGVPGWIGEAEHDLRDIPAGAQEFQGIPFDVISPESNGGRACVGLSQSPGYGGSARVPVHDKAASFYLLHAASGAERTVGTLTIRYADGSSHSEYVEQGKNIGSWWEPHDSRYEREGPRDADTLRIAWQESAHRLPNIGVYAAGFNNPYPDREIDSLVLTAGLTDTKWMVLAATLGDTAVFFAPYDDLSSGIPDGWNAAIAWAILEGLAGVKDDGTAFSRTRIAPRWEAVGVSDADVTVRYPASAGYCSYRYARDTSRNVIRLDFTGSGREFEVQVLLPKRHTVTSATLDGASIPTKINTVENSRYAVANIKQAGLHHFAVALAEER